MRSKQFNFLILACISGCLNMITGTAQAGSILAPELEQRKGVVHYLELLNSNLSPAQLDAQIEGDDVRSFHTLTVSRINVSQSGSRCDLQFEAMYPTDIANDPTRRDQHGRNARKHCLKALNFQLNERIAGKEDLARESFVCTVSGTRAGISGSTDTYKEGMSGVIVQPRIFRDDKITKFDDRKTVEVYTPGTSGTLEYSCQINPELFAQNPNVPTPREVWRASKIAFLSVRLQELDTRIGDAKKRFAANAEIAKKEIERLETYTANLDRLVEKYNKCLNSYRAADRYIHLEDMKLASWENGTLSKPTRNHRSRDADPLCPDLTANLKKEFARYKATIASEADPSKEVEFSVADLTKMGRYEADVCEKQIAVCERPSGLGMITDFLTGPFPSGPKAPREKIRK